MAEQEKYTATQVAALIGRSVPTITLWYEWYNNPKYASSRAKYEDIPELPMYEREGSETRGTRYWTEDQIDKIKKFRDWIKPGKEGQLGDIHAALWNNGRGDRALLNKQLAAEAKIEQKSPTKTPIKRPVKYWEGELE